jgi:hypothetical protein
MKERKRRPLFRFLDASDETKQGIHVSVPCGRELPRLRHKRETASDYQRAQAVRHKEKRDWKTGSRV